MKVKLIKVDKGYYNLEDGKGNVLGTSYQFNSSVGDVLEYKLSDKNCDEIFGVVDVEKLAEDFAKNHSIYPTAQDDTEYGFKQGFKKAMELNKDKVFTEQDIINAMNRVWDWCEDDKDEDCSSMTELRDKHIQSLQQPTEIEVEIEMICPHPEDAYRCGLQYGCDTECYHPNKIPYLDSEGCLILKKI